MKKSHKISASSGYYFRDWNWVGLEWLDMAPERFFLDALSQFIFSDLVPTLEVGEEISLEFEEDYYVS